MIVALALVILAVAFALVWRGRDVRVVLFAAALLIGALAGQAGAVFRKTAETLSDAKFALPICTAMGFAFAVRETGCADALVRLLLKPLGRFPGVAVPGTSAAAFLVNTAVPSQSSTAAAVGPLAVPTLTRLRAPAIDAATALVLGASICGALLNPGLAEVAAMGRLLSLAPEVLVVRLAPAALAALLVGIVVLRASRRSADPQAIADAPAAGDAPAKPSAWYLALLPPLPIAWLMLGHPSLPWRNAIAGLRPVGLEVFAAMIGGGALVLLLAARDRRGATQAFFNGMGYGFGQVMTILAVSTGVAKALELAGVLDAAIAVASGRALVLIALVFALSFALAVVSGSSAAGISMLIALGPRAGELGCAPHVLAGAIIFAAEAGRTASPVSAVLLVGSELTGVPPRDIALRLALPCLLGAAAGAAVYAAS